MAQTVHLKLKINGSDIEGESKIRSLDREGTIECSSYQYGITTPREHASGAVTGRRQHGPVVIQKHIDKSTPLLLKALCQNELVESAEFMFFRRTRLGKEERFFTVMLENGYISGVEQVSEDAIIGGVDAPHPMEKVEFVFQDITWTYEIGGVTHRDSWSGE